MQEHDERTTELIELLKKEYKKYCSIPEAKQLQRREQKQFINGMMTAARVFGVSFEDLENVVKSSSQSSPMPMNGNMDIPAYIRSNKA